MERKIKEMFHYFPPPDSAVQDVFTKCYPAEEGFGELKAADIRHLAFISIFLLQILLVSQLDEDFPHVKTLPVVKLLFFAHLAL